MASKPDREELVRLASERDRSPEKSRSFTRALESADEREIAGAVAMLGPWDAGERVEGYRDAALAMLEIRLTERLAKQTRRLECVGVFVGVVGLVLTVVQICQGPQ